MSKKEKLRALLDSLPSTMAYSDIVTLLESYGLKERNKGKTSGSRVQFYDEKTKAKVVCHKPHDGIVKNLAIKDIKRQLDAALAQRKEDEDGKST